MKFTSKTLITLFALIILTVFTPIKAQEETCIDCHDEEEFTPILAESVHADNECADCHTYAAEKIETHGDDGIPVAQKADCISCHEDIVEEHKESVHGLSIANGFDEAAQCWSCHGGHDISFVADSTSKVNSANIAETCDKCHADEDLIEKYNLTISGPGAMYSESIHGKLVKEGKDAARCESCHGVHDIKNRMQPNSKIASYNIPETCGECHSEIAEEYKQSIHWLRARKGIKNAPVCNDCHSEHSIKGLSEGSKRKKSIKLQQETCLKCHQDLVTQNRYTSSVSQAASYQDSYHGLAIMRDDEDAAMCVDCHDVHKILPAMHAESSVSKENVTATCQKCHENATENFSVSYSHQTIDKDARFIESVVENVYFWMIIVVIGGMVIHNLIIFIFEIYKRRQKQKRVITVPRFTKNELVQHLMLLVTFILLAITGFALKYPNSWWAEGLQAAGMTETVRQWTHRISAVLMLVAGFYHVFYLFATGRGREVLLGFLPTLKDLTGAKDNVLYHLGIKKEKPEFEVYNYAEKAEYWALIWGTFVMGATGFILWFPTIIGDWAPVWLIKVSEIIHFYEAILATLAIIVWHWFFVIFHPGEYPMSFTWIDGEMTINHYKEHHRKHFKKVALELVEVEHKTKLAEDLSVTTKLFVNTLKKHGFDPYEVVHKQMHDDAELKAWIEDKFGTIKIDSSKYDLG
ncbi:MAG: cytochrome b/b6 domain-containing protein [Melioribacteraceae bacterium]|nr:cytochrome b/b6 domain-containing protein [Melioribacteraceae bacterium]